MAGGLGSGSLDVRSEDPDVTSGKSSPSSVVVAVLTGAEPVVAVSLMKDEVKQEPDRPEDVSLGTSTHSGTGSVSPNPEGTMLGQLQTLLKTNKQKNMTIMDKISKISFPSQKSRIDP